MQKTYNAISQNQLCRKRSLSNWLLSLIVAFGVGFMLGGE